MTPAERKEWAARRKDFVVRGPCCMCGGLAHDVHEILAGANRQAAFVERATWLRVCRTCHDRIQGRSVGYQLALKLLSDPQGWDLSAFCRAWNRAETAVDTGIVLSHVQQLLIERGL